MANQRAASENWVSGVKLWHYAVEGRTRPDAVIPVKVWYRRHPHEWQHPAFVSPDRIHIFYEDRIFYHGEYGCSSITICACVRVLDAYGRQLVDRISAVGALTVVSEAGCL